MTKKYVHFGTSVLIYEPTTVQGLLNDFKSHCNARENSFSKPTHLPKSERFSDLLICTLFGFVNPYELLDAPFNTQNISISFMCKCYYI